MLSVYIHYYYPALFIFWSDGTFCDFFLLPHFSWPLLSTSNKTDWTVLNFTWHASRLNLSWSRIHKTMFINLFTAWQKNGFQQTRSLTSAGGNGFNFAVPYVFGVNSNFVDVEFLPEIFIFIMSKKIFSCCYLHCGVCVLCKGFKVIKQPHFSSQCIRSKSLCFVILPCKTTSY